MSGNKSKLDTHCYACGRKNDSQVQALVDKWGGDTDEYEHAVTALDKERSVTGELDFVKGCAMCGR